MNERDHTRNSEHDPADRPIERADHERTRQWTFHSVSPGDSHDKGEQSLCVGEAA